MSKVEPWERPQMQKCYRLFILFGFAGMALLVGLNWLFSTSDVGRIALMLIWIPWLISGMFLVPWSFHKGVECQRGHQAE